MAALRKLGVRCVVAFSAVGSLREEIKPRDFVVPGQVIDRTKGVGRLSFLCFWGACKILLAATVQVGRCWDACRKLEAHRADGKGVLL